MIRAVFLDAGETILYPHPSFSELFAQIAQEAGYEEVSSAAIDQVRSRLAPHLVDMAEDSGVKQGASLSAEDSKVFWSFLYRRFLEELGIQDDALVDRLFQTFSSSSTYRLYDDVLEAIGLIKQQGHLLGLISNFERWLEEMLVELEVGHIFDIAVISGVEGVEKPDTSIYRLALERAGVAPEEAVHVGDSITLDVQPARAVGMHAVLLDRTGRYRGHNGPVISSLKELPPVISNFTP